MSIQSCFVFVENESKKDLRTEGRKKERKKERKRERKKERGKHGNSLDMDWSVCLIIVVSVS